VKKTILALVACVFAFTLSGCSKVQEGREDINKAKESAAQSQKAIDAVKKQVEQMGDNGSSR